MIDIFDLAVDQFRQLIEAHSSVRPIESVTIWGRDIVKAQQFSDEFDAHDFYIDTTDSLKMAVAEVDVVNAVTMSQTPLFDDGWVFQDEHVDLIGAFSPDMRETDDTALRRSDFYIDTLCGRLEEAGNLISGVNSGAIRCDDFCGVLSEI